MSPLPSAAVTVTLAYYQCTVCPLPLAACIACGHLQCGEHKQWTHHPFHLCPQFTWGFPPALPPWVEAGAQGVNGYLRFTATRTYLRVEAVVAGGADDGAVMDSVQLAVRPKA